MTRAAAMAAPGGRPAWAAPAAATAARCSLWRRWRWEGRGGGFSLVVPRCVCVTRLPMGPPDARLWLADELGDTCMLYTQVQLNYSKTNLIYCCLNQSCEQRTSICSHSSTGPHVTCNLRLRRSPAAARHAVLVDHHPPLPPRYTPAPCTTRCGTRRHGCATAVRTSSRIPAPLLHRPVRGARGEGLVWCVWAGADCFLSAFKRQKNVQRKRKTTRW